MRFAAAHKTVTFLMVLSGLGAVLLSGEIPAVMSVLLITAFVGAFFVPVSLMKTRSWETAWTMATLGAFALSIAQMFLGGDFIQSAVFFLLFLVINKLYNRRKGSDYSQLYVVSLMTVIAGAAVNMGLSYLLCFSLHTVFGVWSLTLFQLRREMEENYLLRHSDNTSSERVAVGRVLRSRRIVGWSFLGLTGAGALSVLLFSGVFFVLFPRMGLTRSGWGPGRGSPMLGFSENVELGKHGLIRDNPHMVMRVSFSRKVDPEKITTVLWRGMTFDRYLEGRWSRSSNLPRPAVHRADGWTLLQGFPGSVYEKKRIRKGLNQALEYNVVLMPSVGTVLPVMDRPVALSLDGKLPGAGAELVVAHGMIPDHPEPGNIIRYKGRSFPYGEEVFFGDARNTHARAGMWSVYPLTKEEVRAYLSLPAGLPRSFYDLAGRLKKMGADGRERLGAAMRYMSSANGFVYSRHLAPIPRGHDPVVHFLLREKSGHCEYYASALVLLARAMDVPARLVTGFLGGKWNDYGEFLGVRQGDAHAWVEAYLESEGGWIAFDPTPPAGRVPARKRGFLARLELWLDSFRLAYLRWIVDYDMHAQWSLASGARGWVRGGGSSATAWRVLKWIALSVLLGMVLFLVYGMVCKRAKSILGNGKRKSIDPAGGAYERLLKALGKMGYKRRVCDTPREFASGLSLSNFPAADMIMEVTEAYYSARYGDGDPAMVRSLVERALAGLTRIA